MIKLQHPVFPTVIQEVEDPDEQEWLDAGWIPTAPEAPAPDAPATAAAPNTEPAFPFSAPSPDTMEASGDEHN